MRFNDKSANGLVYGGHSVCTDAMRNNERLMSTFVFAVHSNYSGHVKKTIFVRSSARMWHISFILSVLKSYTWHRRV